MKNIAESIQNPSWFYDQYESVAQTRTLPKMNRTWRPQNAKY